ncbi:BnaC09g30840D [Brassica napus]|uniref:BnaC09g30840D protein n=1 Tax=Brassica napus TaxID=3708 RepID=A0A078FYT6_BRANA|nr:BnaC09g30840D [Brassica napus]
MADEDFQSGEEGVEARAARFEGEEGGDEDFGDEDDDWSIRASMGLDRTLGDEVTIVQVRKRLSSYQFKLILISKRDLAYFQLKVLEFTIFIVNSRRLNEYDKVALGKEDGGKGVSMEDAISRPCGVRIRDPCANHAAVKMRLKEDELEANKPNGESQSTAPPNRKIDISRGVMKGLRDDEETRH